MKTIDYYESEYQKFKQEKGFYLGYECFQREHFKITNLHLIGIMGAPGSGKTTLTLNIACNIIQQTGLAIKLYSLDKTGIFITDALKKMSRPEIDMIDIEDKIFTIRGMYNDIKRDKGKYACIVIDFLYKIDTKKPKLTTIYDITNEQVKQLDAFQKVLKIPIFVLIQPNRGAGDGSEFPTMIQGEGSAKIEQTMILLLSLCRPDKDAKMSEMDKQRWHNIIKVKAVKNSFGVSDIEYELYFEPETLIISNK